MGSSWMWVVFALAVLIAACVGVMMAKKGASGGSPAETFEKMPVLTKHEQSMFWRLKEAFPGEERVILAQVSLGALLRATGGASRNRFNQKRADFVVLDRAFSVLCIVELDDSSHAKRKAADAARDAMLTGAGYRVLRYPRIPSVEELVGDIARKPGGAGRLKVVSGFAELGSN